MRRLATTAAVVIVVCSFMREAWATNWIVGLASGSKGLAQSQSTPSAPTGVAAACVSSTTKTITISWTAVTHATSYAVYQSTNNSTYTLATTGVTTTSWTTASLTTGKQYWYKVTVTIGSNWVSAQSTATGSTTISSSSPNCSQPSP